MTLKMAGVVEWESRCSRCCIMERTERMVSKPRLDITLTLKYAYIYDARMRRAARTNNEFVCRAFLALWKALDFRRIYPGLLKKTKYLKPERGYNKAPY